MPARAGFFLGGASRLYLRYADGFGLATPNGYAMASKASSRGPFCFWLPWGGIQPPENKPIHPTGLRPRFSGAVITLLTKQ